MLLHNYLASTLNISISRLWIRAPICYLRYGCRSYWQLGWRDSDRAAWRKGVSAVPLTTYAVAHVAALLLFLIREGRMGQLGLDC